MAKEKTFEELVKEFAGKKKQNRTDKEWESYWDAEALAKAEIIKADPKRLKNAQVAAAAKLLEEKVEAAAMARVAKP